MALKADHSTLPTGNPPDKTPRYAHLLAEAWRDANVDEADRPMATPDARLRASWAGKCARDISRRLLGLPATNPPDLAAYWRMGLGSMVHEHLQPIIAKAYPGASIEHVTDWKELGIPGASHVDVYLVSDETAVMTKINPLGSEDLAEFRGKRTVIEIKTTGGFAYKLMVGARGPAQGPKSMALLQAALSARALQADEVVIIYLSMECLSQREADKIGADEVGKFASEWTFPMSALNEMVDQEITRLGKILELVDAGEIAPRYMPGEMPSGARVTDPGTGAWTLERGGNVLEAGQLWACAYCDSRDWCISQGQS